MQQVRHNWNHYQRRWAYGIDVYKVSFVDGAKTNIASTQNRLFLLALVNYNRHIHNIVVTWSMNILKYVTMLIRWCSNRVEPSSSSLDSLPNFKSKHQPFDYRKSRSTSARWLTTFIIKFTGDILMKANSNNLCHDSFRHPKKLALIITIKYNNGTIKQQILPINIL